ncbi:MAG: hypothetical protein IT371_08130 [Deltaproteobacteria bacterium]|nr:hypothetical protein [Deltaproteobacteria bacterium]
MREAELDQVVRAVTRMVTERLGRADAEVVALVAREVAAAVAADARVGGATSPSGSAGGSTASGSATDNGDGTMTTPLGAVLPRPSAASLSLCTGCVEQSRRRNQNRAVVTATGRNRRGVIATLTAAIAESGGDVEDVSQTIVSDYFTLIILVDTGALTVPLSGFKEKLQQAAAALGVHAVVMHEDVVRALQRV